ncbi:MAG TPA: rhomboid family intramembrane serine protease, partial [Gammaproteobacteria bacterium]|nr:rhomboid family intramembrane serine protease [Gammaproteobacteria bacterium]
MDWRNLERFPEAMGEAWQARRGRSRIIGDKGSIDAAVSRWTLLDPLLISRPGARRFLPVLAIEEYREAVQRSLKRRQLMMIAVLSLLACGLALSGWAADRASAFRAALASLAIAGFGTLEYQLVIKRPDVLFDRALLTLWVVDRGRTYALGWTAMMLVAGALQLGGEHIVGGHERLVLAIGAVNARVLDGEVWRLVVGPFLHAGPAHWFGNLAFLVFSGAVAGALLGRASVALFVGASALGALVSTLLSDPSRLESYVGVSAGIFALLGWCAGAAMRRPQRFPGHFAATALGFSMLAFVGVWLLNPEASNVGHIT